MGSEATMSKQMDAVCACCEWKTSFDRPSHRGSIGKILDCETCGRSWQDIYACGQN